MMCSVWEVSSSVGVAGNSSMDDSTGKLGVDGRSELDLVLYVCSIGFFICLWKMMLLEGMYILFGVSTLRGGSFSTLRGRETSSNILETVWGPFSLTFQQTFPKLALKEQTPPA